MATITLAPPPFAVGIDDQRVPDWRYHRVRALLNEEDEKSGSDDMFVREAVTFIHRYETIDGPTEAIRQRQRRRKLLVKNPGLFQAWELFLGVMTGEQGATPTHGETEQREPGLTQMMLEACVLANMPSEKIALRCSLKPDTVIWYERLFYDVRSRLKNKDWVRMTLIGPVYGGGSRDMTFEKAIKYWAYNAGERVLEDVSSAYDDSVRVPAKGQSLRGFYREHFESGLARRSASSVGNVFANNHNYLQMYELMVSIINQQRQALLRTGADVSGGPGGDYQECMLAFIQSFQLHTGREGLPFYQPPLLRDGAVEPRVDQQLQAAGDPTQNAMLQGMLERELNRPQIREEDHAEKNDAGD